MSLLREFNFGAYRTVITVNFIRSPNETSWLC